MRLAGLAATLVHYLKGEAETKVPVWRLIAMPLAEIEWRAGLWATALGGRAKVIPGETMIGGGSLPGGTLPARLVAIGGDGKKGQGIAQLISQKLRSREIPVIGRISGNLLLLDPHSVLPGEDEAVIKSLRSLASELKIQ